MAKSRKRTSIPQLVEEDSLGPGQAINAVRKYLKGGSGDSYLSKSNLLAGIVERNRRNEKLFSETRWVQWRIASYSLLLLAAVTEAVQLSRHLVQNIAYTAALSAAAALLLLLVSLAARKMMDSTEKDLRFYREHARLNEEMLNMTVGLEKLAAAVIASRQPDLEGKHYFWNGAGDGALTPLLNAVMIGAGVIAFVVSELLVWLT